MRSAWMPGTICPSDRSPDMTTTAVAPLSRRDWSTMSKNAREVPATGRATATVSRRSRALAMNGSSGRRASVPDAATMSWSSITSRIRAASVSCSARRRASSPAIAVTSSVACAASPA